MSVTLVLELSVEANSVDFRVRCSEWVDHISMWPDGFLLVDAVPSGCDFISRIFAAANPRTSAVWPQG